jgi:signal transduction histidine kinase
VATAYIAAVALLGVVPAAAFDPHDQGCAACPYNLASVRNDPGLVEAATRWGLRIALVSTIALAGLLVWRAVSAASTTRVVTGPVHTAAAAYLALVAVDVEHSLRRNFLSNDAFDMRLWRWEAGGLVLIAVGVAWGLHRARQARTAVARLVLELASVPAPGGVRDALASALGDPTLRLAYRRDPDGGYVDAAGRVADLGSGADHASTPLMRGGRPIAVIVHDVRVLDRPGVLEDAVAAAHLAIENERLQAEVRAQLEDLRRSRVRIVETADEARRRLERDLHDGAQQRLVGLVLLIRMLQSRLAANKGTDPPRELAEADGELRAALEELRDLAHGIFPAVLADEGLGAALETLAESHATAIELGNLPEERFDSAIENAAYAVVVETLKQARPTRVRIRARRSGSLLIVELESDGDIDLPLSHLEDRVGALDGRLTVNTAAGRIRVRAELPCG